MGDVQRAVMTKRGDALRSKALEGQPTTFILETINLIMKRGDDSVTGTVGSVISVGELSVLDNDDLSEALAKVRVALVPNGKFWFVDYGGCTRGFGGIVASHLRSGTLTGGFYLGRSLPERIRQAGFIITDIERFDMPTKNPILRPWVQGVAIVESRSTPFSP